MPLLAFVSPPPRLCFKENTPMTLRCSALVALLACVPPLSAAPFVVTAQQRYISLGTSVSIENAGGEPGGSGSAGDYFAVPAGDFSALDRELRLDATPLGTVGLAIGRAVQRSAFGNDQISFYGLGDLYVQLLQGGDVITGGSSTSVGFSATFTVTAPTTVRLALSSTPSLAGNDFRFGLSKANGQLVWGQTSVEQPDGSFAYSFEQSLALAPGVYSVGAFVGSNYSLDGIGDSRAEGQFSLTAVVPEPGTVWLLLAGAGLVLGMAHRRAL